MTDIEKEKEANYFAMHLLVPTAMLRKEYARLGPIDFADDNCPALRKLCQRFDVSPAVMLFRITEETLSTQPVPT